MEDGRNTNSGDRNRDGGIMDRHRDVIVEINGRRYILPEHIAALLQNNGVARVVCETEKTNYERRGGT